MSSQERLFTARLNVENGRLAWPVEATADGTRHSADNSRR